MEYIVVVLMAARICVLGSSDVRIYYLSSGPFFGFGNCKSMALD